MGPKVEIGFGVGIHLLSDIFAPITIFWLLGKYIHQGYQKTIEKTCITIRKNKLKGAEDKTYKEYLALVERVKSAYTSTSLWPCRKMRFLPSPDKGVSGNRQA